jgi:hypothetical protein
MEISMNVNILAALNGVAIAAANAGDMNTVSLMQQAGQICSRAVSTYDATATSSTQFLNLSPPNFGFFPEQFDSLQKTATQLGVSPKVLGG